MSDSLLKDLNDAQRAAVSAPEQAALVLAGAGSGKTRVLVYRIAWLCHSTGCSPNAILAVTFTNKAAQEMRERVAHLIDTPIRGMWLGTFHALCHRILRTEHQRADLPQGFQVIDSQDQLRLIRRIIKNTLAWEDQVSKAKEIQWLINAYKEEGKRYASIQEDDYRLEDALKVYKEYEIHCQRFGLVDFAELLLRAVELLRDNPDVLQRYQHRFRHILVDEFQDTNTLQYAWLKLLSGGSIPVFAVGDDDQSIYGWRGARPDNIKDFQEDFDNAKVFRLEQNYRSTGNILKAANAVIENNKGRMGKELWTDSGNGEKLGLFGAFNEYEEASFIVEQVKDWEDSGRRKEECAVLYRSNAQSRVIEEALFSANVSYKVYGGLRFFERAVVKHVLAYLRLSSNAEDNPSFERIINFPPRRIGKTTLDKISEYARANSCSLWKAGYQLLEQGGLTKRAAQALNGFYEVMEELDLNLDKGSLLSDKTKRVVQFLKAYYEDKGGEDSLSAIENLDELILAAEDFENRFEEEALLEEDETPEDILDAFLTRAALEAGEAQGGSDEDCVQLMTLHSAKGLEFPSVLIVGFEEGLFPHERSMNTIGELEEERRLCYVGITRAREQLMLSYAEERKRSYDKYSAPCRPSRFIDEIPADLINELRRRMEIRGPRSANNTPSPTQSGNGFALGQSVCHEAFGTGTIIEFEGRGEHARALIHFEDEGKKWLILAYAELEIVD